MSRKQVAGTRITIVIQDGLRRGKIADPGGRVPPASDWLTLVFSWLIIVLLFLIVLSIVDYTL